MDDIGDNDGEEQMDMDQEGDISGMQGADMEGQVDE
jgi:hypothetical protein